ncbi:hypothetical protein A9Q84_07900 [Halobacteriovorax marinus]|uniref:PE-PGRS family protein n=1 Tax=Halobacteriovorax marinus TaxID=97084 RepID=A0A1Y5FCB2_9BACT|nr:hypothetical protein A9Q84_07900 [Halobacteriovorax marinus]
MIVIKTLFLFFLPLQFIYALDTGTGSDGVCNLTVALNTSVKSVYNCTEINVTAVVNVTGNTALILKSQGNVTFSGTGSLVLDGIVGANGANTGTSTGGSAGPGGFAGGGCLTDAACGGVSGDDGASGGNGGQGFGGNTASSLAAGQSGGGGGGGARFGTVTLPTSGTNGLDDLGGVINAGAAGVSSYAPESAFESLLVGGSGGGSGGGGDDSGTLHSGGAGGGGGGVLRIQAGGDITVNLGRSITSNGGNGGDGSGAVSGGGGAGSGGAIFLQAEGNILINGSVNATGGTGGDGTHATNNDGGSGGSGRIRFDDGDGIITGTGTITPAAYVTTLPVTGVQQQVFESPISCGSIGVIDKDRSLKLVLSMVFIMLVSYIVSKRSLNI